jgi:hypothetical protein
LVFEKSANYFTENVRKSQNISIICSIDPRCPRTVFTYNTSSPL